MTYTRFAAICSQRWEYRQRSAIATAANATHTSPVCSAAAAEHRTFALALGARRRAVAKEVGNWGLGAACVPFARPDRRVSRPIYQSLAGASVPSMAHRERHAADSVGISDAATATMQRGFWAVLNNAATHVNDGRTSEAVLIAQTACEVAASRAINALRGHLSAELWIDLVDLAFPPNRDNSYSMMSNGARKAWIALTGGDDLTSFGHWASYEAHVRRRNRVAHRDEPVTPADAQESVDVARAFLTHVEAVTRGVLGDGW